MGCAACEQQPFCFFSFLESFSFIWTFSSNSLVGSRACVRTAGRIRVGGARCRRGWIVIHGVSRRDTQYATSEVRYQMPSNLSKSAVCTTPPGFPCWRHGTVAASRYQSNSAMWNAERVQPARSSAGDPLSPQFLFFGIWEKWLSLGLQIGIEEGTESRLLAFLLLSLVIHPF
ncbi:hypothetical protein BD289DRAFT_57600 [Coniella lustricola]|uniref:Uncharacterized protein n=1 Tax=Coniella lustricola TaxID=2025994 RepID=A0A2T3AI81_9PEZI|nr:hypothetical protein BD289DRAFT_57600 [Coniella lustricola]